MQFYESFFKRHPELKERVFLTGPINVFSEAALQGCNMIVTDVDASEDMTDGGALGITVPVGDIQKYVRHFFDYDRIVRRLHTLLLFVEPVAGKEGRR